MFMEAVLVLNLDTSFKPEIDQMELTRSRFQYDWREGPFYPDDFPDESTEQLFRKLLETIDKQQLEQSNKVIERTRRSLV